MDFALSEDQIALRDLARQILSDRCTNDRLREIERSDERFDRELWSELARANLLGIAVPEREGGMGLGFLELCLLIEEVGRHVAPIPALPTLVLGALPLAEFGSAEQRARTLGRVAAGECVLSAALAEEGNEEACRPQTVATRDGGGWRLDGIKTGVPYARIAERLVVPAGGEAGVGLFLLDPHGDGVRLEDLETTAGEPACRVTLNGTRVGAEDVLRAPPDGAEALEWLRQRAAAACAALQLGVSERALRMTAAYTAEREQFGRKLSTFQAVAQRAANAFIDVESLRLPTLQAIWRLSEGLEAGREVAIAKYWAGDTGHRVSYAAQHLHGGIGVDMDYPLHRYCLWSKQIELTLGSSTQQLLELGTRLAAGG